tara:strand:+ start:5138 stop:5479 length:342 start_codon:yes stop_codon:yes gene_type:complete
MKYGVNLKIDVSKIDKELLFKGAKGVYLDATVFIDPDQPDQYKNHGMITQSVSKESRESGERGAILGNVTVFWTGQSEAKQGESNQGSSHSNQSPQGQPAPSSFENFEDDVPF